MENVSEIMFGGGGGGGGGGLTFDAMYIIHGHYT